MFLRATPVVRKLWPISLTITTTSSSSSITSISEELARVQENDFQSADGVGLRPRSARPMRSTTTAAFSPSSAQIAGDHIAPRSEKVDHEGNVLNDDGTVTLGENVRENLHVLSQADLMGFTLPRKYEGLNCPTTLYTMATEIVSRADASLMNLFGPAGDR